MRRNFKRVLAGLLAATMVMGTASAVMAEGNVSEGSGTGTGEIEAVVDKDVFEIELPTIAEGATPFDFILDPQGLITATTNAAYSGATFSGTTGVYFLKATNIYADTTQDFTIKSKSSMKVDVSVVATVDDLAAATGDASIVMTGDKTFASDTSTSLYLALTDGTNTAAVDNSTKTATLTKTMEAVDASKFEVKYDGSEYKFALKADATDLPEYTFKMTGACNTATTVDWSAVKDVQPTVDVVWTVVPYAGAAPTFATGDAVGQIKITSNGDGNNGLATIESIKISGYDGYNAAGDGAWAAATTADSVITLDSKFVAFWENDGTAEATITYKNTAGETKTATVTVTTKA